MHQPKKSSHVTLCASREKKSSRVPRYQNGEKLSGTAIFRVKSPHIGGDLERVDVSFSSFLCAREKDNTQQGLPCKILPRRALALQKQNNLSLKISSIMKWSTIKKLLQIIATVITTILGTNIIQSCM